MSISSSGSDDSNHHDSKECMISALDPDSRISDMIGRLSWRCSTPRDNCKVRSRELLIPSNFFKLRDFRNLLLTTLFFRFLQSTASSRWLIQDYYALCFATICTNLSNTNPWSIINKKQFHNAPVATKYCVRLLQVNLPVFKCPALMLAWTDNTLYKGLSPISRLKMATACSGSRSLQYSIQGCLPTDGRAAKMTNSSACCPDVILSKLI